MTSGRPCSDTPARCGGPVGRSGLPSGTGSAPGSRSASRTYRPDTVTACGDEVPLPNLIALVQVHLLHLLHLLRLADKLPPGEPAPTHASQNKPCPSESEKSERQLNCGPRRPSPRRQKEVA